MNTEFFDCEMDQPDMMESMKRIYSVADREELIDTEIHNHDSRCGEIRFIDAASPSRVERIGFSDDDSLFGGARKSTKKQGGAKRKTVKRRASETKPLFRSLVDVPDDDIQHFISRFKLGYIAASPKSNAIFIIPDATAMKLLELDLKEKVKAPDTPEGVEQIKNGDLLYKRYIMDIYGGGENEGFEYRIPLDYPDHTDDVIRRRQTREGNPLFIKLTSKGISVSQSSDMSNAVSCKYRMKVGNESKFAAFVFEGNLSFDGVKNSQKKITHLRKLKQLLINNRNDSEKAAYNFVGLMASTHGVEAVKPYYSADLLHTSLALVHAFGESTEIDDSPLDEEVIEEKNDELLKSYTLSHPISNYSQLCQRMSLFNTQCMDRSMSAKQHLSSVAEQYSKVYSKLGLSYKNSDITTDVGYGIYNQTGDLNLAIDAMLATDELMKGGEINPLMYHAIIDSIDEFSFAGANAHQYLPMTCGLSKRKSKHSTAKKTGGVKKTVKSKASKAGKASKAKHMTGGDMSVDEEIEINDNDLEFEGGDESIDEVENGDGDDFDIGDYL